jgi:hypothetical protein
MIDFELDQEQKMLTDAIRRLAEERIRKVFRDADEETDRNCHFGFFAVLGQNSVFSPNYDCFRKSNQNFPATPTPRSVIPVYFCRQPLIRVNATKLKHITPPRSHINSDFEVLSCSA